jgi:hypothetical protein
VLQQAAQNLGRQVHVGDDEVAFAHAPQVLGDRDGIVEFGVDLGRQQAVGIGAGHGAAVDQQAVDVVDVECRTDFGEAEFRRTARRGEAAGAEGALDYAEDALRIDALACEQRIEQVEGIDRRAQLGHSCHRSPVPLTEDSRPKWRQMLGVATRPRGVRCR